MIAHMDQLIRHLGIDRRPLVVVVGDHAAARGKVAERVAALLHEQLCARPHDLRARGPITKDAQHDVLGGGTRARSNRVLLIGTNGTRLADDPGSGLIVEDEWLLQPGRPEGLRPFDLMIAIEPHLLLDVSLRLYRARTSGRWGAIVAEMPAASRAASPAALSIADAVLIVTGSGAASAARTADLVRSLASSTSHTDVWITQDPERASAAQATVLERSCRDMAPTGFELRFVA